MMTEMGKNNDDLMSGIMVLIFVMVIILVPYCCCQVSNEDYHRIVTGMQAKKK